MLLTFLNQLDDNQIIDLLNYIYEETSIHKVKQVQVFREQNRRDGDNNQEILVNAWDNDFHIGVFSIQDFTIRDVFGKDNCKKKLREYMASIFGEEYLNALREFYAIKAYKEIERIKSTLGEGRS